MEKAAAGETSTNKTKIDRKTAERNRRIQMNDLCSKLVSIIPPQHFNPPREFLSQQDQLDQAAAYIKNFRQRLEELRAKKTWLELNATNKNSPISSSPVLTVRELGSSGLEVVVITGVSKQFKMHQAITIIEEGGAEVISVNISTIGGQIVHTLHAQVKFSRVGVDTQRICERIQELIS